MSTKALAKGSSAPGPVPAGTIRLYSMRFCPFAQRVCLVLEAKKIKCEIVNVNLMNKPDWFLQKNPLGMVPTLETCKNELVYDSPIVCEYLDDIYPANRLLPTDPYEKAKQKMLLEQFSKVVGYMYRIPVEKRKSMDTSKLEEELQVQLSKFEQKLADLKTSFFGGDSVTMIDYWLWPWFERMDALGFNKVLEQMPRLKCWMQLMQQDAAVKASGFSTDVYREFYELYFQHNPEACDYHL
ncbi:glutathione S-transferase omega-1-like [Hemiscyllium ocellatum]|uniref:glutathione S-transferase omega-1-like n=1 Tax=Hemiscyllium ocellatum TaxID=170820 RepID=UPI0029674CEB|nr:glutathione S-transferase omega-1-like [Hemiscyllium ocellatum]